MKKNLIAKLVLMFCLIIGGMLASNNVSAQDVWAYTDDEGTEYYVATDKTYYERYSDGICLYLHYTTVKRNGETEYNPWPELYDYYWNTGRWTYMLGLKHFPVEEITQFPNLKHIYPLFKVAREYVSF